MDTVSPAGRDVDLTGFTDLDLAVDGGGRVTLGVVGRHGFGLSQVQAETIAADGTVGPVEAVTPKDLDDHGPGGANVAVAPAGDGAVVWFMLSPGTTRFPTAKVGRAVPVEVPGREDPAELSGNRSPPSQHTNRRRHAGIRNQACSSSHAGGRWTGVR